MSRVISARKIRDKMPRWLWELRPDCGHFHYEKVDEFPQQPVHVICRVCVAQRRMQKYLATLTPTQLARYEGRMPLSSKTTETEQRAFNLDGGVAIPQEQAVQEVAAPPAPPVHQEKGGWAHLEGPAAEGDPDYRGELPACMRPRPGAPAPRRVAGASGDGPEGQAGVAQAAKTHRRYRKRGPDPNQTRLFD